jgi:hypothetical protein
LRRSPVIPTSSSRKIEWQALGILPGHWNYTTGRAALGSIPPVTPGKLYRRENKWKRRGKETDQKD